MKKTILLLLGVILFVILFYDQGMGSNLSIFSIILWMFLLVTTPKANRSKPFWAATAALLLSAGSFAWYGDFISFAAIFCSLAIISCKLYAPATNLLLIPFASMLNFASFLFRAPFLHKWLPSGPGLSADFYKKVLYYFLVPAALTASFLLVYTSSSNLFQSFFFFNWNINVFQLSFLTIMGFFLMFSFIHYWVPDLLLKQDRYLQDTFPPSFGNTAITPEAKDIQFYQKSGQISLIALNLLVIFFIITYTIEQFGSSSSQNNISQSLHERVYLLIFSIAMAISVIMLFFKGALNFSKNSGLLKTYAFIWIILNMLLAGTVVLKNNQYVDGYGLTFKRIGVYLFLFLAVVGLVYTAVKIRAQKTNIYLLNRMAWTIYGMLIISAAVNWSWIVTRYNLNHAASFDKDYAIGLPYNKQLLYDKGLLSNADFIRFKADELKQPFLSQRLYYRLLKP